MGGAVSGNGLGGRGLRGCRCVVAGKANLPGLLLSLAEENRQPLLRIHGQYSEIRRIANTAGSITVEEFHAAERGCRGNRRQSQEGARQGPVDDGQRGGDSFAVES